MRRLPVLIILGPVFLLTVDAGEIAAPQSKPAEAKQTESRIRVYGWIESGITGNFAAPNPSVREFNMLNRSPLIFKGLRCCQR